MASSRRFLLVFFAVTMGLLIVVPVINLRTDYSRVLTRDYTSIYEENSENLGYLKLHWVLEHREDYDSLIFGSSRVRYGFDPDRLDAVLKGRWYKMEYPGGSQYQHYEYLRRLLSGGFVPRRILLTVDDFDLWKHDIAKRQRGEYNRRMAPSGWLDTAKFYAFYLYKNPGSHELDILRGRLRPQPSRRVVEDPGKEIPAQVDSTAHARHLAVLRQQPGATLPQTYHIDEPLDTIRRFVKLCDDRGIRLDIVFLPSTPVRWLQFDLDAVREFERRLAEIHPFQDFGGIFPITMNPTNWADLTHFHTNVGDEILEIVEEPERRHGEFGIVVTPENVEAHYQRILRTLRESIPVLRKQRGKLGLSPDLRRKLGLRPAFRDTPRFQDEPAGQ